MAGFARARRRPIASLLTYTFVAAAAAVGGPTPLTRPTGAQATVTPADTEELGDLEARFRAVADRVAPAVVAISASTTADDAPGSCRSAELTAGRLQSFLNRTTRVVGTGFVVDSGGDSGGYILTNDHVIDEAEQLWVTTDDKRVYPAIVVGSDPRSDLAVLRVPARGLPCVTMGDGTAVRRGQWSVAVGNPYGLSADGGMCVSVGVVSAVGRSLPKLSEKEDRLYANLIQTTAQINPGNSGGPLFDLSGRVIGVTTAVVLPQRNANGVGFAVPVDARLREVVDHLERGDEVVYAYLGVVVSSPTEADLAAAGLTRATGARVDSVQADSPAAGRLRPGDIVVACDGHPVDAADAFVRAVGTAPVTRPVSVVVRRDGADVTATVTMRKRPMPVAAVTRATQHLRWAGMLLGSSPDGPGVAVLSVNADSPFAARGVLKGAVVHTVGGRPVRSVAELQDVVNATPWDRCELGTDADPATASIR